MKNELEKEMTEVGHAFRTGERAPVSGIYEYVGHMTLPGCNPNSNDRKVTLTAGEFFPPHRGCGKGVIWRLFKISTN